MNIYHKYIQQALMGAKYHENLAFSFAHPKFQKYDEVVFHIRAYFWELWSIWDYILQLANLQTLKLPSEQIRGSFLERLKIKQPDYKYLSLLGEIWKSERLSRIKCLRDHAHKWQIDPYLVDYNGDVVNVISINNLDRKDKNLPRQINIDKNDLWFMKNTVKTLFLKGFLERTF